MDEGEAFGGEDTGGDSGLRMQAIWSQFTITFFRVTCTIDDAGDLTPTQGTGTHDTWFKCDVYCAVGKIFTSDGRLCRSQGLHFGMSSDVAKMLGVVMCTSNYLILTYNNSSDRHFVDAGSGLGLFDSKSHVVFIGHNNRY